MKNGWDSSFYVYNKSMAAKKMKGLIKSWTAKIFSPKRPLDEVSGLYLGGRNYLHVTSQPSGRPEYVSGISGVVTRFEMAFRYGNIGLIAHNYLAGKHFLELQPGKMIHLMNGKGRTRLYRVTRILQYQALNPRSPRSNFIDLETHAFSTAAEVFERVYMGKHHLVLQTCIQKGNIEEWGRHFVIAEPVKFAPPSR